MDKPNDYYSLARNEVFELIAGKPENILECGCGFGALGKHIKQSWPCTLTGLELNPEAEPHLRGIYDSFYITNLEDFDPQSLRRSFDCIIYADVLEHLRQPKEIIQKHLGLLKKGGQVIISIPNIRNLKVISDLLIRGQWNYGNSGILDRTHYKFFTLTTLKQMLQECGLEIEHVDSNKDRFSSLKKAAAFIPYLLIPELKVCQWLIRARKK